MKVPVDAEPTAIFVIPLPPVPMFIVFVVSLNPIPVPILTVCEFVDRPRVTDPVWLVPPAVQVPVVCVLPRSIFSAV